MAINEVLELTLEDRQLLEALSRVNAALKATEGAAGGAQDALGRVGGSGGGSAIAGLKGVAGAAMSAVGAIGDLAAGLGKLAVAMGGSVFLAMRGVNSGLRETETGLRNLIKDSANESAWGELAGQIRSVTNGIIDMGDAAELARRGKGIGLSDKDVVTISKLGTAIGLTNSEFNEVSATRALLDALTKGEIKSLATLNSGLYATLRSDQAINSEKDVGIKRQRILNALLKNQTRILADTGGALDSPFTKLLGVIQRMKDESRGLMEVMGGIGKVALAALAPIGAGLAGFAFGGPIVGAIGTVVGALISGSLATILLKTFQGIAGKDRDSRAAQERMGAIKDVGTSFLGGFLDVLLTGSTKFQIEDEKLTKAFDAKIDEAREKAKKMFGFIADIAHNIRAFTEGFAEGFGTFQEILKSVNLDLKDRNVWRELGKHMGELMGHLVRLAFIVLPKLVDGLTATMSLLNYFIRPGPTEDELKAAREHNDKIGKIGFRAPDWLNELFGRKPGSAIEDLFKSPEPVKPFNMEQDVNRPRAPELPPGPYNDRFQEQMLKRLQSIDDTLRNGEQRRTLQRSTP